MKNQVLMVFGAFLLIIPVQLYGAAAQTLADFKAVYIQETAKIQTNNALVDEAAAAYLKELAGLETRFKKDGDFPGTKAVLEEKKRFVTERKIPDVTPDGLPEGIGEAQAGYRSTVAELSADRNARLEKLTLRYVKALRKHTAVLLEQDKMELAEEVNKEIERVMALVASFEPEIKVEETPIIKAKKAPVSAPVRTVFVEPIALYGGTGAGLAVDKAGNLYIAENRQNGLGVTKVDPEGRRAACFPPGMLGGVTALAVDGDGALYVADGSANGNARTRGNDKVWKVGSQGKVEVFIPSVRNPCGLAFDSKGYLYVASFADNSVYKYSQRGEMVKTVASGFDALPYGLAVDRKDNIYVAAFAREGGANGKTIYKISKNGNVSPFYTSEFSDPYALAFDRSGNLWVSFYNGMKIVKITSDGVGSQMPGGWTADDTPNGIAFDNDGNLFVAVNGGRTTASAAVLKILNVSP